MSSFLDVTRFSNTGTSPRKPGACLMERLKMKLIKFETAGDDRHQSVSFELRMSASTITSSWPAYGKSVKFNVVRLLFSCLQLRGDQMITPTFSDKLQKRFDVLCDLNDIEESWNGNKSAVLDCVAECIVRLCGTKILLGNSSIKGKKSSNAGTRLPLQVNVNVPPLKRSSRKNGYSAKEGRHRKWITVVTPTCFTTLSMTLQERGSH